MMSGLEIIQPISKRKIKTIICLMAFITLSASFIIDQNQTYAQDYSITDLDEINRYIARHPNDPFALVDRGSLYHDYGEYDKAIADFSKAIHIDPENYRAYHMRGMTYGTIGESERAIRDFRSMLEIEPNSYDAYRLIGLSYLDLEEYEKAIEALNNALELAPDDSRAYLFRGDAYFFLGDDERAYAEYTKAIQYVPNQPGAYTARADVNLYLEQYDQAIEDCNIAIGLDPEYEMAYFTRGNAFHEKGDYKQAIENYQIALRIDPDYEMAREWLEKAQTLIDTEDEDTARLFGGDPFGDDEYGFDDMDTTQWFTNLEETSTGDYSEDQIEIVNRLDPPESFTIMVCAPDEDSDEVVRTEIWNYYSMQSRFVFTDGKLIMTEEIEAIDENAVLPKYTPDRFVYGMSFKEVIDFLGEMEFALAEVIDEYVENGDLYFTEQLVLGFKDDMLFYVESLPLIPEEDED